MRPETVPKHLRVLSEPGLPPLFGSGGGLWTTALPLPALWPLTRGLPARVPYTGNELGEAALETNDVIVHVMTGPQPWPSDMQLLNCATLLALDTALTEAAKAAITREAPALRPHYDFLDDLDDVLPAIFDDNTIARLMRLNAVIVQPVRSATPYLGLDFACAWDDHGFGLMLHGTSFIAAGGSDIANDKSLAEAHQRQG